jgi:hypothetical protein
MVSVFCHINIFYFPEPILCIRDVRAPQVLPYPLSGLSFKDMREIPKSPSDNNNNNNNNNNLLTASGLSPSDSG